LTIGCGARDAKLVLVGHSMGGLIARHFLECLEGWRDTRTLVTFGTPYRGSLNALDTLVNGKKIKFFDLTEVARSFTAIHQLLPTYPSYDGGDGNLVRVDETDIPHLDRAKAKAALDFHREIRDAVDAHLKDDAYVRARYDLGRVVGIKQPTQQSALRDGDRIKLRRRIGSEDPGGDGTVPRPSATPLELEDDKGAAFSAERHASLQNDDHVLLQLTGVLTGNAIDWQRYRGVVPMVDLSLDVHDLYSPSEPLVVQAQPDNDSVEELVAVTVDVESGEERARKPLAPNDQGWHAAELGQLPEGVYRITVFGGEAVEPVSDLVTVLAE
jgi:Lecithin:cholesterol acyltransferase